MPVRPAETARYYAHSFIHLLPLHEQVIFDTGSDDIELTSTSCVDCGSELLFDPSMSSTFVTEEGAGELDCL